MGTLSKFFPNLNSFRGIAALMVVFSHIEYQKPGLNFTPLYSIYIQSAIGAIGVTCFFVLSGFLITWLLLSEGNRKGKIDIRKFYLRRVFRIWPLFFLVLIIAYFILPSHLLYNKEGFILNLFFLTNIAYMLELIPTLFHPLWSIGVEEQFYLFWPHIFKSNKIKVILNSCLLLLVLVYGVKVISILGPRIINLDFWELLRGWSYLTRFDSMIMGGITSILYYNHLKGGLKFDYYKILISKKVELVNFVLLITYLLGVLIFELPVIHQLFSILVSIFILNLATNPNRIISIEAKILNFVGKISYGVYLIHNVIIFYVYRIIIDYFQVEHLSLFWNIIVYITVLGITFLLSHFVFKFYETPFLKLKSKYASV